MYMYVYQYVCVFVAITLENNSKNGKFKYQSVNDFYNIIRLKENPSRHMCCIYVLLCIILFA